MIRFKPPINRLHDVFSISVTDLRYNLNDFVIVKALEVSCCECCHINNGWGRGRVLYIGEEELRTILLSPRIPSEGARPPRSFHADERIATQGTHAMQRLAAYDYAQRTPTSTSTCGHRLSDCGITSLVCGTEVIFWRV